MRYVLVKNEVVEKYPYNFSMLKQDNPNTSFPELTTDELFASFNVYPVQLTQAPSVDYTKNIQEEYPAFINNGWVQVWKISDASQEEVSERLEAAWSDLRNERNFRLSASDWTQVADAPVDQAAWASYRQALRDLPANTSDPFEPVWPVKPT